MVITENILRLICFTIVGLGLLGTSAYLKKRGVKWIDEQEGKVRGHSFAFVATFMFISFLFLGFIFDFVAIAWNKMGDWVVYGYGIVMVLFTGTNVTKILTDYGIKKTDLLNRVSTVISETSRG